MKKKQVLLIVDHNNYEISNMQRVFVLEMESSTFFGKLTLYIDVKLVVLQAANEINKEQVIKRII